MRNRFAPPVFALLSLAASGFTPAASACRCVPRGVDRLAKDPGRAQSAFILRREGRTLRVDRAWHEAPAQFRLAGDTCDLDLTEGRRYLVLSVYPPKEYVDAKMTPGICGARAFELDNAGPQLEAWGKKETAGANPAWDYCVKDEDCARVPDTCTGAQQVNARHLADYQAWRKKAAPAENCRKTVAPEAWPPIKCTMNLCGG